MQLTELTPLCSKENRIVKLFAVAFAILLLACTTQFSNAQKPIKLFSENSFSEMQYKQMQQEFGQHKVIPQQYRHQILIALSYFPELKNITVEFRIKHTRTPLATIPSALSIFKKNSYRKYIVTISDSTIDPLSTILLKQLNFNAQVGVLGHELSHVAFFNSKSSSELILVGVSHVSSKWVDHFEFNTDSACIGHGLGYQLLDWSISVRKALHIPNWDGADNIDKPMTRERYMNPNTIRRYMRKSGLYEVMK